ncbi:MAG: hypothetical protein EOP83_29540 [Verrucomicrobiaceae bacterium]|nr:MAG: hypothetical protein EOP83_29540 [Verrucomicrobiaceae bacterium]
MPRLQRITIVLGLWLLAGATCAIFSDVELEAGESEATARLQIVFLTPLLAAIGITAWVVLDQQNDFYLGVVWWLVMACFLTHAIVTLTRRDRRQFMVLVAVQILMLGGSVVSVIGLFRYLAETGP